MIIFHKIKWRNFLSTGNQFTEIDLDKNSTSLIIGKNGAGKSSILDALAFVLYGKAFRKVNKPQLVNSTNGKDLRVEIDFTITDTKKKYKIVRGIKPAIFEIYCGDELINQDSKSLDYQAHLEDTILKMNFKSFSQTVILGSATYVPFMQLSAAARREVIEDLLDLQVFSNMNSVLKTKISANKDKISDEKYNAKLIAEKIKLAKSHLEELDYIKKDIISKKVQSAKKLVAEIQDLERENEILLDDLMEDYSSDISENKSKSSSNIVEWNKFNGAISALNKEAKFYTHNNNCPTCHQEIDSDFKDKRLLEINDAVSDNQKLLKEIEDERDSLAAELVLLKDKQSKRDAVLKDIDTNKSQITFIKKSLASIKKEIEEAKKPKEDTKEESVDIKSLNGELRDIQLILEDLSNEKEILHMASVLLKDGGIKTRIIRQYVPLMNKLINRYLSDMDFPCQFELDEAFNETIKSRFRDDFSYASFSEGEKLRINLAILFTWRTVSKMRNSASSNLLLLDEIADGSLDDNGFGEFMKIIQQLNDGSNVFIISHKVDTISDKFENVIEFEKNKGFSMVKENG